MSALDSMAVLVSEISSRAERLSWSYTREPRFETLTELESATLLSALRGESQQQQFELPEQRAALLLRGNVRLLITAFDEQSELLESCKKALWWAGLVRGSLRPIGRSDLHLLVVATAAIGKEDDILRDRSRIEADERICRKYVWLPDIDAGVAEFLDSTLLAYPWMRTSLAPQSLDPLQRLAETAGLGVGVASRWISALSSLEDAKSEALAEVLSNFYEEDNSD